MKKIYELKTFISINGEEFEETSLWGLTKYGEVQENKIFELNSFSEAYDFIASHNLKNVYVGKTAFFSKPALYISTIEKAYQMIVTEKTFKPIKIKIVYDTSIENTESFKTIANSLSAKEFCEWLRDEKINISIDKLI